MSPEAQTPLTEILARLARAQTDEEAWRELYQQMWPFVLAVLFRQLHGARELAEDAAQEVFLRLLRYGTFEDLQNEHGFRAYLTTICRNVARNHLRQALRHEAVSFSEFSDGGPPELAQQSAPEKEVDLRDILEHILDHVTPHDHLLAQLSFQGFTLPEIVKQTGMRYEQAAVRLHRLRRRLRKFLAEQGLRNT